MASTVINGLSVRSYGNVDAPITILFIHYWGGTARTWEKTIGYLLESNPNLRAVAYDQRGWGASAKPEDDPAAYSVAGLATAAEAILAGLVPKPKRVVLVGHSMGGKIAQLVGAKWKGVVAAQADPPTLAGLFLVGPTPPSTMIIPEEAKQQMLHAYDSPDTIRFSLQNVLTAANQGRPLSEELAQQVIEDSSTGGKLARESWVERGLVEDISKEVTEGLNGEGNVPTLLLVGEYDKIDSREILEEKVIPNIQGAKLKVIPSFGHLLPLEAPKEVGTHLAEFISAL